MGFSIHIDLALMPLSLTASFYLLWLNRAHHHSVSAFPIQCYIYALSFVFGPARNTFCRPMISILAAGPLHSSFWHLRSCRWQRLHIARNRYFSLYLLFCVLDTIGVLCGKAFRTSDADLTQQLYPDAETGSVVTAWAWTYRSFLMAHNILWGTIFGKIIRQRPAGAEVGDDQYSTIA